MKEYRIVVTLDTEHVDGRKFHYDACDPWFHGISHKIVTKDKEKAKMYLTDAIERCAEFDEVHSVADRVRIKYVQTNIRIQTREVTEWEDLHDK